MSGEKEVPSTERIKEIRESAYDYLRCAYTTNEMREVLAALDAAQASIAAVEQWAMKNEIAEPPLDWDGLGKILHPELPRAEQNAMTGAEPPHREKHQPPSRGARMSHEAYIKANLERHFGKAEAGKDLLAGYVPDPDGTPDSVDELKAAFAAGRESRDREIREAGGVVVPRDLLERLRFYANKQGLGHYASSAADDCNAVSELLGVSVGGTEGETE